jgi:hypothetical protein
MRVLTQLVTDQRTTTQHTRAPIPASCPCQSHAFSAVFRVQPLVNTRGLRTFPYSPTIITYQSSSRLLMNTSTPPSTPPSISITKRKPPAYTRARHSKAASADSPRPLKRQCGAMSASLESTPTTVSDDSYDSPIASTITPTSSRPSISRRFVFHHDERHRRSSAAVVQLQPLHS